MPQNDQSPIAWAASQTAQRATNLNFGDLAELSRPDLPPPRARVRLVCGPPASGKSTYVRAHAAPDDIVIDLDLIAREFGYGRKRPASAVAELLAERNRRLAALATEAPGRVAWVILSAPSKSLREWWAQALGAESITTLIPPREELRRRIMADPDRAEVRQEHLWWVDKWFAREREDNPGLAKRGCNADGYPSDSLHSWNHAE